MSNRSTLILGGGLRLGGPLLLALALTACATAPPPPAAPSPQPPAAWQAPLPHGGNMQQLDQWWQRFDDAQLSVLIARAQARNPSLQMAAARLRQAQADADQARALLAPQVQAQANLARSRSAPTFQAATLGVLQGAASWEIDLFGAQRAQAAAGTALAQAAQAQWHEARVSLAAEVAQAYLALRHAQVQEELAAVDVRAAEQLAQWGRQQQAAGLMAAADSALLNTQLALAQAQRSALRAEARIALNSLAELCAADIATLRQELAAPAPTQEALPNRPMPAAPPMGLDLLPAQVLAQRPDLLAAHQQWLAAVQGLRAEQASAWPQLSLGALLGQGSFRVEGGTTRGAVWSVGPSLSLPLFDAGLRSARRDAAAARVDEAAAALQQRWHGVVGEVEAALERLQAAGERRAQVDEAQKEWQRIALSAAQMSGAGLQSGPQRVATQRQALAALSAAQRTRYEHASAWVRLYRTLGGGWQAEATDKN